MIKKINFVLNNELIKIDSNPNSTLLNFIRKTKHLSGTKEVCREGDCGACSVLIGELDGENISYKTVNSCIYPLGNCEGKHIVTIEGLNQTELNLIQESFIDNHAAQCGFCTPGFIVAITGYLLNNQIYETSSAIKSLDGNICRCTGYGSIRRAIDDLLIDLNEKKSPNNLETLIEKRIVPVYFKEIPKLLSEIEKENDSQYRNHFIAGGTDLFVQKGDDLLDVDSTFISSTNLNYIHKNANEIIIGGGTTFEEIKQSSVCKEFSQDFVNAFDLIASLPIRNSATIAGNIINASPIGDLTIMLLALNAEIVLSNKNVKRKTNLRDFYLGYKILAKNIDEYIEEIIVKIPTDNFKFSFEKVSKRKFLDIASVNSASLITFDKDLIVSANISAGGVAPTPKYLIETSNFFAGKSIDEINFHNANEILQNEIQPISDVRGSAEYKRLLLLQLIKMHFIKSFNDYKLTEELLYES
ncbi:MAG: xanthine dehydrogenase small subunit [Ignavibacteriales bacterium]